MKKILLSASLLIAAFAAKAQECAAVETINEDFSDFTISTSWAPENCWNKIALGFPNGGLVYTKEEGEPVNQFITYYSATAVGAKSYLISPEVSNFDGAHELSFSTWKLAQGGEIPAGTVTIQVGTISDVADASTFVPFGTPITVTTGTAETHENIIIPSAPAGSHIAFEMSADTIHNAIAIDDFVWEAVPAAECAAVETFNEDFADFGVGATFPYNCWNSIAGSAQTGGPLVYSGSAGGSITYYAMTNPSTAAYVTSPEVSTIDGAHQLSFTATPSVAQGVTLQLGYITDAADAQTFTAVGEPIALSFQTTSYSNIVFPAIEGNAHIAFKFTGADNHQAAVLDNVSWQAVTAGNENFAQDSFKIYPNPASGSVNINTNGGNGTVSIYSLTGNRVLETAVNSNSQNINVSALSAGMYIVRYANGTATATQKLIIQ